MTKYFKPEFRQEAADAMNVGKSTVDRWVRDLRKERNGEEIAGAPISEERRKISALECGIQQLKMEKEMLKIPQGHVEASALLMSDSMSVYVDYRTERELSNPLAM